MPIAVIALIDVIVTFAAIALIAAISLIAVVEHRANCRLLRSLHALIAVLLRLLHRILRRCGRCAPSPRGICRVVSSSRARCAYCGLIALIASHIAPLRLLRTVAAGHLPRGELFEGREGLHVRVRQRAAHLPNV